MPGRRITVVEMPTNLGLARMPHAVEPGVRKLPDWLKTWGLHARTGAEKTLRIKAPAYRSDVDPVTGVRNADAIIEYAIAQSAVLENELDNNTCLLVLGGDCSILIGCALALKKKGTYGLFYLDGHTDFIEPGQSETKAAAGMDLAIVCGLGHPKLTNIQDNGPYLDQRFVYCVGNREYDEDYEAPVKTSSVSYFPLHQLREIGTRNVALDFLDMVDSNNLDGFFIHLDADVLDDTVMAAVDSRQADGLSYAELKDMLIPLLSSRKAVGMEITILDPDLDADGKYTKVFVNNILSILKDAGLI